MAGDDTRSRNKTFKDIVRFFTPAWFAVNMGTGAISIIFHAFPFGTGSQPLHILALAFFLLNLALFVFFLGMSITRYIMFPDIWTIMLHHPVQSMYLGTFPMGGATLITVATNLIHTDYGIGGKAFLYFLWAMWWIDVAISIFCCFGMVHVMKVFQVHSIQKMTTVWLLPVVTLIVGSSTGNVVAQALQKYNPSHALLTATTSAVLVTIGLSLALMMLTIYLQRLIIHGLPPGATIVSVFLPLGPTGQAGFSFVILGQFLQQALPLKAGSSVFLTHPLTGHILDVLCTAVGLALWSLCTMWMVFAFLSMQHVLRRSRIPFKLPFWGLIFPNGVYANLTVTLGERFDSPFFKYWGAIYDIFTVLLWIGVASRTVALVWTKEIFEAPCLEDMDIASTFPSLPPPLPPLQNGSVNTNQD